MARRWLLATLLVRMLVFSFTRESGSPAAQEAWNGFGYHGGKLMVDPINIHLVWVGNWTWSSMEPLRNAIRSLAGDYDSKEYPNLVEWWRVVTSYHDSSFLPVSDSVSLAENECCIDRQALSALQLKQEVDQTCQEHLLEEETGSNIYIVLVSKMVPGPGFTECRGDFLSRNGSRRYFWIRETRPSEFCNLWGRFSSLRKPPSGDSGLDSMISSTLALVAERATNPLGDGYRDADGNTVSSRCPSPTGREDSDMPVAEDEGISWNVFGKNGSRYVVQQLWSLQNNNCALQLTDSCSSRYLSYTVLTRPSGYISQGLIIDHRVGLQPYKQGVSCLWLVQVPGAKFFRVRLNYMALGVTDVLKVSSCSWLYNLFYFIFKGETSYCKTMTGLSDQVNLPDVLSSDLYVEFYSSFSQAPHSMGWEIFYQAGYCTGTETESFQKSGTLSDGSPARENYLENHRCQWTLDAEWGTKVHLEFTRFNTVAGRDLLTVYSGKTVDEKLVLEVFSGSYDKLPRRTYLGPVSLVFSTRTGDGSGWSLNFIMEHPAGEDIRHQKNHLVAFVLGIFSGMITFLAGAKLVHWMALSGVLSEGTRRFSREELEVATDKFSRENELAPGLFRGVLANDQIICVQRLERSACSREYELLSGMIKHPSVVSVLGVCHDSSESLLVFRNMSNGPVSSFLFSDEKGSTLTWERRVMIGLQVSGALRYLHTEPCLAHRRVSCGNIFLESSWSSRLGDFSGASPADAQMKAGDVYRMGVVILELLTGKSAWNDPEENELSYGARWAVHLVETGEASLVFDRRLLAEGDRSLRALLKMAEIGAWCMREKPRERPGMVEVAEVLGQVESIFFGLPRSRRHQKVSTL